MNWAGWGVGVWGAGKQEKWPLIFAETTGRMMVFAGELGGQWVAF